MLNEKITNQTINELMSTDKIGNVHRRNIAGVFAVFCLWALSSSVMTKH
jgi:hypothetical protein